MDYKTNLREWAAKWNYIFWQASKLVGAPVLFCLTLLFMQKLVFTGTCSFAGYKCDQSLTYATAIAASVNNAVSSDAHAAEPEMVARIETGESGNDKERFDKVVAAAKKAAAR
jgi:hypothetical protein